MSCEFGVFPYLSYRSSAYLRTYLAPSLALKRTRMAGGSALKGNSCVHWLGSSATRAFGECLGDKRR